MKILVLQLSDIHIKTHEDPILARPELIARAAVATTSEIDMVLVLATGDIAFSGSSAEYSAATKFLETLQSAIRSLTGQRGLAPHIVQIVIPGNHDCMFQKDAARDIILDRLRESSEQSKDPSIVAACTAPQKKFFEFMNLVNSPARVDANNRYDNRLMYEYRVVHGGESVHIVCCNTAWVSKIKEEQGTLHFPAELIELSQPGGTLRIGAFHHPEKWLQVGSARAFRKAISANVDIVFTGHEHEPDQGTVARSSGSNHLFVEGGVLQESDAPETSTFNVLLLDTKTMKQVYVPFAWDGSIYVRDDDRDQIMDGDWEELRLNKLRKKDTLEFSHNTMRWIDDPELNVADSSGRLLKLSDFFEFPDLRVHPGIAWVPTTVLNEPDRGRGHRSGSRSPS